jgi:hypothetical protein
MKNHAERNRAFHNSKTSQKWKILTDSERLDRECKWDFLVSKEYPLRLHPLLIDAVLDAPQESPPAADLLHSPTFLKTILDEIKPGKSLLINWEPAEIIAGFKDPHRPLIRLYLQEAIHSSYVICQIPAENRIDYREFLPNAHDRFIDALAKYRPARPYNGVVTAASYGAHIWSHMRGIFKSICSACNAPKLQRVEDQDETEFVIKIGDLQNAEQHRTVSCACHQVGELIPKTLQKIAAVPLLRETLLLSYDGLTPGQIAQHLQMKPANFSMRVSRPLDRILREELAPLVRKEQSQEKKPHILSAISPVLRDLYTPDEFSNLLREPPSL